MDKSSPIKLPEPILVNGIEVTHIIIGRHYRAKHASYMNDELIVELVQSLDGKKFKSDSSSNGIDYFAADIELVNIKSKTFRLVWLFEGELLEVIGVINAYRVKKGKK